MLSQITNLRYIIWSSHKKRKDSLETRAVLLILLLELEIFVVAVQSIHQNSKKLQLCEELFCRNESEAVLATFCYYHSAKAFEAVQKVATNQKEHRKCSLCVSICWIAKIYLSINNSEKYLVTRKLKLHRKKSNNGPMVSFIHNES